MYCMYTENNGEALYGTTIARTVSRGQNTYNSKDPSGARAGLGDNNLIHFTLGTYRLCLVEDVPTSSAAVGGRHYNTPSGTIYVLSRVQGGRPTAFVDQCSCAFVFALIACLIACLRSRPAPFPKAANREKTPLLWCRRDVFSTVVDIVFGSEGPSLCQKQERKQVDSRT